ncbi:CcoQ/FixQ family Cbb3-type cytochrome c oxidase assembly chaperone [Lysobacteraceae bacterium NML91-0213]|nr:CcoQ/FixQ family Cbb3-type cytochrome c oxidase assembly chaperone [Xanthomonadaceae bacterium NML91-0213]
MVSGIVTLLLLLLFVGGWVWAWSPRRKRDFDEAAQLPLADDEVPPADRPADGMQDGKHNGENGR